MRKLGDKKKEKQRLEHKDWVVYVCTPAYDGKVSTDYAQSMVEAAFCCPLHLVRLSASVIGNGAFIDLARNVFVKKFLEQPDLKECTHLFFIDADLRFPPNAFIGLIRSGLPIVAGVYPRRQEKLDFPCQWTEHEDGGLWVEEGFVMHNRVPTGFLCIERKVLEEMAADAKKLDIFGQDGPVPQLFYTKVDENNKFVGEDFCFCDDYIKKYKKPIPVWPDIDFVHGDRFRGNYLKYLDEEVQKAEKEKLLPLEEQEKLKQQAAEQRELERRGVA